MSTNTWIKPVFDDTAMRRLEDLVAKCEDSTLSADEALDLAELRLLKAEVQHARERAAIAEKRRRGEDRDKYRLGGLAFDAGLKDWPDNLLTAGFAYLAGLSDREKAVLLQRHANSNAAAGSGSGTPAARAEG
ncbi:MAG: hypothetical protein M0Z28_18955 [Rhodospirillales bacterium]|nr:hypothetical protein [Rhodospirillales bacterium]